MENENLREQKFIADKMYRKLSRWLRILGYDTFFDPEINDSEILSTEINVDLLKQLSLAWGIAPSRQYNRRPAKSELKVAIGLNNVHYVLNGDAMPDWIQTDELENNNNDDDEVFSIVK